MHKFRYLYLFGAFYATNRLEFTAYQIDFFYDIEKNELFQRKKIYRNQCF